MSDNKRSTLRSHRKITLPLYNELYQGLCLHNCVVGKGSNSTVSASLSLAACRYTSEKAVIEDMAFVHRLVQELAEYEKNRRPLPLPLHSMRADLETGRFSVLVAETGSGVIAGMALYYPVYSTWKGLSLAGRPGGAGIFPPAWYWHPADGCTGKRSQSSRLSAASLAGAGLEHAGHQLLQSSWRTTRCRLAYVSSMALICCSFAGCESIQIRRGLSL